MSVGVELEKLLEVAAGFRTVPLLLTTDDDGRPRASAVSVSWAGDVATIRAGHRSVANARQRALVSLLWRRRPMNASRCSSTAPSRGPLPTRPSGVRRRADTSRCGPARRCCTSSTVRIERVDAGASRARGRPDATPRALRQDAAKADSAAPATTTRGRPPAPTTGKRDGRGVR